MPNAPKIKIGTFRHSKTGKLYEVIGVALQTETGEPLVVYKPLYESHHELFARPYEMFIDMVEINGVATPRFERIDD